MKPEIIGAYDVINAETGKIYSYSFSQELYITYFFTQIKITENRWYTKHIPISIIGTNIGITKSMYYNSKQLLLSFSINEAISYNTKAQKVTKEENDARLKNGHLE